MNVLILGSGARENAFAWKISQSPLLERLFVAPGNPGCRPYGTVINLDILDFASIGIFCLEYSIGLILVGPELPLVKGIKDYFSNKAELSSIFIIGPDKKGARLEGSKAFSKAFMQKYNIPTAGYKAFTKQTLSQGQDFLRRLSPPYVIKADGLAAGKGVIITSEIEEAQNTLKGIITDQVFGEAGNTVVIEEFLTGIELSVFILTDGEQYLLLPEAKDYKRIGEADTGLNTGGMGAVSPVPFANKDFMQKVDELVIQPTLHGLRSEGIKYEGFIFFGLMNCAGNPYVIEYNCRMGDPETQAVLPRIKNDFLEVLLACAKGNLNSMKLETLPDLACTVVTVAGGYPDKYEKGNAISQLPEQDGVLTFQAGTAENTEGKLVTNGGRVMVFTALATTFSEASSKAVEAANTVQWHKKYFRSDIGFDLFLI